MDEHPLMHLVHAAVLGLVAYVLMRYFLKQSEAKAMTRLCSFRSFSCYIYDCIRTQNAFIY